jgi:hypothetical protein
VRVIRILGRADGSPSPEAGRYVVSLDPDASGGRGHIDLTHDVGRARRFRGTEEAWEWWRRQSTVLPLRPDGKPNRPGTAFTVMVQPVPKEGTP